MKIRKLIITIFIISAVFVGIYILKIVSDPIKSDSVARNQNNTDIGHIFSVNNRGVIAYVIRNPDTKNNVIAIHDQYNPKKSTYFPVKSDIADIAFGDNDDKLYFATKDKISNHKLQSTIYIKNIKTGKREKIIQVPTTIKDIDVNSNNDFLVFYGANDYENMEGITGAVFSDYAVYKLDLNNGQKQEIKSFNGHRIEGLGITPNEKGVLLSSGQQIWKIDFKSVNKKEVLINAPKDVYDIATNSHIKDIMYIIPTTNKEKGVFDYEIYSLGEKGSKQITNHHEEAAHPVLLNDGEIYYLINTKIGKGTPNFLLYKKKNFKDNRSEKIDLPSYKDLLKMQTSE